MLIGYMIEYLYTNYGVFVGIPSSNNREITIQDYYNTLEKEISKWGK